MLPPIPGPDAPGEHPSSRHSWSPAYQHIPAGRGAEWEAGLGTLLSLAEGFPFPWGSRENCFPLLFKPLLQPVPPACVYSPAGLVSLFTCLPQDSLG